MLSPNLMNTTVDWNAAPLDALIQHLLDTHHVAVRQLMERVLPISRKVAQVHGPGHPPLIELAASVHAFIDAMELHLRKEEEILFPAILHLIGAGGVPAHCPIPAPINAMRHEHETAQADFQRWRGLTDDFAVPEDACNTFRGYFLDLQAIEQDTLIHIHKENEVLFPRVLALVEA